MEGQKTAYRYFSYILEPGKPQPINFVGNYLNVLTFTGNAGDLLISINGQSEQYIPVGLKILVADGFNIITLRNTGGANATVELNLGNGDMANQSLSLSSGTINVNPTGDAIVTPAKITSTAIAGAVTYTPDPSCREIIIYNNSLNVVWVGDSNVDGSALRGIPILPNEKIFLTVSAKLYFHSPGGNSDISVSEIRGS